MLPFIGLMLMVAFAPVDASAPTAVDAQWAALAACPRVGGGPGGGTRATAVCIGCKDGFAYLLTAAHAVPKGEPRAYEFFTRESYPKVARTLTHGEVVVRLTDPDLALVKLPVGAPPAPVVRLAGPGARPKRFPVATAAVGCPRGAPPTCRAEKLIEKAFVRRPGGGAAFFWGSEGVPVGGMSGGPLLDAEGRVIGICAAAQGGRGYFAHLDEIHYALKRNGYDWLFTP
ncbi:serine protease [Gemmata sp. JC717]|uniref:S1 family peptidase n=1 Tax=Gemmata algarum TaxID=2975278 RepID=UPI0021BB90DD|nr:serine protease [Gemmata algarum]MDY3551871.1 serine protease [Gemmata algarum]